MTQETLNRGPFHFVGIGGIGMSGLAKILIEKELPVSGSDQNENARTLQLEELGAKVHIGHAEENVPEGATLVYSTDIHEGNPELAKARAGQLPTLHRSDLLRLLMKEKKVLSVAGSHGKTTTTSLLAVVMEKAGLSPSFMVGGMVTDIGSNAAFRQGEHFVVEADESDGTFTKYDSYGAIVTNIGFDHLDHYGTKQKQVDAFKKFVSQVESKKHFLWCKDNEELNQLDLPGYSYGFSEEADIQILHYRQIGFKVVCDVKILGELFKDVEYNLVGRHNAENCTAVFALGHLLGIKEETLREGLREFKGVGRRLEKKGEVGTLTFFDDYAHHPTEIRKTLLALKKAVGSRRLVAVFQPHRYSRIRHCLGKFRKVFNAADVVIITDLYSAGEAPIQGVSSDHIYLEAKESHPEIFRVAEGELTEFLSSYLMQHDVVATLGAGDITHLSGNLMQHFKDHPLRKLKMGVVRGGESVEHEISHVSSKGVIDFSDPNVYDLEIFDISKEGNWLERGRAKERLSGETIQRLASCDLLFPILHGPNGEDGTIQGFFEMLKKPYVGPSFRGCSIGMDKILTKQLLLAAGVPTPKFLSLKAERWRNHPDEVMKEVQETLEFPVFVKGSHLGSSIGVIKVESPKNLEYAIDEVFLVDSDVLIEQGVVGRELEFPVMGNDDPIVFPPGEILTNGKMYDYDAKYGPDSFQTTLNPDLPEEWVKKGMELAKAAYVATAQSGMARIDFLMNDQGEYFVTEINPIPGFTPISLFPKVCAKEGIGGRDLIHQLVIYALERSRMTSCL